jgi:S-adenosylmethionine hydrolase
MIFLFTDYGGSDIYVGQIKIVLQAEASGVPVIDLLHEAPVFNVRASAHLLAALAARIPSGSVTLAVIDPEVGSARDAVVLNADGCWFVGPDNGLLSVLAARAGASTYWRISWRPLELSASFHGRDLFAPIAAALACGPVPVEKTVSITQLTVDFGADDLAEIVYVDHYGNAMTGLRSKNLSPETRFIVGTRTLGHKRTFSDARGYEIFWYENSLGLVEIAGNSCSAAKTLGLAVGQYVGITV